MRQDLGKKKKKNAERHSSPNGMSVSSFCSLYVDAWPSLLACYLHIEYIPDHCVPRPWLHKRFQLSSQGAHGPRQKKLMRTDEGTWAIPWNHTGRSRDKGPRLWPRQSYPHMSTGAIPAGMHTRWAREPTVIILYSQQLVQSLALSRFSIFTEKCQVEGVGGRGKGGGRKEEMDEGREQKEKKQRTARPKDPQIDLSLET